MGDLKNRKESQVSLPPGFLFHPTEQQLLCYYLSHKNQYRNCDISLPSTSNYPFLGFDVIREIELYNYDPCDLPEFESYPFGHGGSKKHWYCFTVKVASEGLKRKTNGGFWKRKGRSRNVLGGKEGPLLGKKRTFVFYRGNSSPSRRTNWVMIEYSPVDHRKDSFVLCRVVRKFCGGNKIAEHVPSSYAEESIVATPNIGVDVTNKQHGGSTSVIGEVVHEDTLIDTNNEIEKFLLKSNSEPDDPVVTGPVSKYGFGSSVGIPQSNQQVKTSDGFIGGGVEFDDVVGDKLITNSTILEGDFIELDDLVFPLLGIDSLG